MINTDDNDDSVVAQLTRLSEFGIGNRCLTNMDYSLTDLLPSNTGKINLFSVVVSLSAALLAG